MSSENFIQLSVNRLPYLDIYGLQLSYVSTTSIWCAAGVARDMWNQLDINAASTLALFTSFVGAGGLDTGTVVASKLYYVYLLGDQTNTLNPALVASLSDTVPVFPTVYGVTYSNARIVGAFATDGSAHVRPFNAILGSANNRYLEYVTPVSVLSSGSSATPANVSLETCVPAVKFGRVTLNAIYDPAVAGNAAVINNVTILGQVAAVNVDAQLLACPTLVSLLPNVSYQVTASDALSLSVVGYEFSL